ncbi:MAG TPA: hypothetical protein VK530_12205, partial [Candidatus Acidoferrum sp.]|nr:hypothetical protein [Candidatus Acidoferrum sp.]
ECVLLSVSIQNRRGVSLAPTNVVLRSLSQNALVTMAEAVYLPVPGGGVTAGSPLFQIRTATNFVCGSPVSLELQMSVPGEGTFAIPFTIPGSTNCGLAGGGWCDSCQMIVGQLTTNLPMMPVLDYTGAPSSCAVPALCPGPDTNTNHPPTGQFLVHAYTNTTANELCVSAQVRSACGTPATSFGVAAYLGSFDTNNLCAGYLGNAGVISRPFSFRVPAGSNFAVVVTARLTNMDCETYTLELFGLPCPPPRLQIAKDIAPNKVRVDWSTAYPGWTLQRADKVLGAFTNSALTPVIFGGRYVQTNLSAVNNEFFRLTK